MTTTELAPVSPASHLPATAAEIRAQVNLIQEVMKAVMIDGVHFGTIPGTPKPTLYKPGSEKILSTFRIAIEPIVTDLSTHDEARYRVETRATAQATGMYLGSGTGEASSHEEKYMWRKAVCQEEFDATPEDRRRSVWKKGQNGAYQIAQVRTNHADVANTILKMAKKRSQIDVTLTVTAASDVFAQDIEDLPEGIREALASDEGSQDRPAARPAPQPPQRKSQQPAATTPGNASARVKVTGEIKAIQGQSDKGPWTKWSFKGTDGKTYGTFDTRIHATLVDAQSAGQVVEVSFTENKYGRNIKTIALIDRQPGDEAF